MRALGWLFATVAAGLVGLVACASDGLLQGDGFTPNGVLPTEPATERLDGGGVACDGSGCDAGVADSAPIVTIPDGATPPSNTCLTARAMGTMAGDTGNPTLSTTGKCSEWLSLRATEDSSSALGAGMKVTLTLTPTGHDFDLYAYFSPAKDVLSCSTPSFVAETRGTAPEVIALTWGEGTVANGSDDGRTITVAVQSAQGSCPPTSSWTLSADGNR